MPAELKRCVREGLAAAEEVFRTAGWDVRWEWGGKHAIVIATPPAGAEVRMPVATSPSHGPTGAANLARWNAKKILRRAADGAR
jgi:hypothetical protein